MIELRQWAGRVVLVTGGAGYLGSALVRALAADGRFAGATLRLLDNLQRGTHHALMDLPADGRFEFVEADIMDPAALRRALRGTDAVIHLAALVQTPFSFEHPTWTEHVNHWGTARMVELCLEEGVRRFLYASSASVYGPGGPFSEDDPPRPVGPYSQSKLRGEQAVAEAAARGLRHTTLRLGTLYGYAPAARFDAVPNRLAWQAAVGQAVNVHGSGAQQRPLLHVADAVEALLLCLADEPGTAGRTLNAASAAPSVQEMAGAVAQAWPRAEVRYTDQHAMARFSLAVESGRLRALGWSPRHGLDDALDELRARLGPFSALPAPTAAWPGE